MPFRSLLLTVLCVAFLPLAQPAPAAEPPKSGLDARRQINLAGRQRMLSQQIVLMLCMAHQGVRKAETSEQALAAIAEFDRVLNGLRFGNDQLGLPMETNRDVLKALAQIERLWPRFRGVSQAVARGAGGLDEVRQAAPEILRLSNEAVLALVAHEKVGGDAALNHTIDIAGRQRMLLMKMTMEACLVTTGLNPEEDKARAAKTMELFRSSLDNLRKGDAGSNIIEPPMWEVDAMLEVVEEGWMALEPSLATQLGAGGTDVRALGALLDQAMKAMADMNEAVWMYENI
ncbi:MAG: type IV pili methyl-accepting chemotaxis transducer N-terminal domain-containing protein [Pseudooceanicola sp.]|nr:type IV pili methyl-accepting chemotaxis transducer N-terminal domain-containing protein [Pseudooceanicola sp.]